MYFVVQVRGVVNTRREIKDTLKMLRLHHINHCVLIPETPAYMGMIRKVKDYVAYGVAEADVLATVLESRGRLTADEKLTDAYVKENSQYADIESFAKAICAGEAEITDLPGLKPVLRLHPPRKGYKSIKRTYQQGGALGNYGAEINGLVYRMR
ncbi:MAG: 50S ribosomal protein L30 [Methanomicrobium sp.]|jgi:large subunit ribosomal protein L30|uniref:50S ribosomal protein L30 n=1 Tax=Methanomicrobium mobile TaxID=2205 RepID=UPI0005B25E15|nr:50S ribosomal protein L30 [Methanomicrobium mobile]MBO4521825.1 50S ribosomal protein L30 [Methanomicrobium sp.]MBP5083082.1 50S ribosomal protein L30 [Methanomicrobium sp.]MBP5475336.1 50S ribosomal protein L30 [Methanomicrobium sp.]MBQ3718499.1 50S ribosomal protein L30 [Methanomicrobium sp.]MBR6448077.1 50S ribosomal protein L30 [Methanomicrobium sp.]